MNQSIQFLCGPPGSGKTQRIFQMYLQQLQEKGSDSAILLLPNAAAVAQMQEEIARHTGGLLDARIMTFDDCARALLRSNRNPMQPLTEAQRLLMSKYIANEENINFPAELLAYPGFLVGLCSFIDELKRAAIAPETFAAAVAQCLPNDKHAQSLARFYARYQQRLTEEGLYDDPGLFWQALHLLQDGQQEPFTQAQLVLVDGFMDFTTAQIKMLAELAQGRKLVITLTLAPDEEQKEGFAAAWQLLQRLQQYLGNGEICWLQPNEEETQQPGPPAAIRHLLQNLWRLQSPPFNKDTGEAVQLLAAPGIMAEVREILRDVKKLLLKGVPPEDICLIFRSLEAYRRPLLEAAQEYGVPLAMPGAAPLATRPSVQAVIDLLHIVLNDYARQDVVKFLSSNFVDMSCLQGQNEALSAEQLEKLACEARIIGGKAEWEERLAQYAQRLTEEAQLAREGLGLQEEAEPRPVEEIQAEQAQLEKAQALFNELANLLGDAKQMGSRAEHAAFLQKILQKFKIAERIVLKSPPESRQAWECSANLCAYQKFLELLQQMGNMEALAASTADVSAHISFEAFCEELLWLCQHETFAMPSKHAGYVMALDAYQARQWRKPYVYLGGLVEGQWPAAHQETAFFDDEQRRRLNQHGLALELSAERQQDEAYLFYLACSVATKQLVLSHPTADSKGDPLLRSPFIEDVLQLFDPKAVPVRQKSLSEIIPQPEDIVCWRELGESLVRRGHTSAQQAINNNLEVSEPQRQLCQHIWAMAAVEEQRYAFGVPFAAYDGMLTQASIQQRLQEHFGAEYRWSASALATYGQCPFRFLLKYVLRLQPLEEPSEEIAALDLGLIAHRILKQFFSVHNAAHPNKPLACRSSDEAKAQMAQIVDKLFAQWENQGLVTHKQLWELARQRMQADMAALVDFEMNPDEKIVKSGLVPRAFEAPYEIEILLDETAPQGETIRIAGKIDRVDVSLQGPPQPRQYKVYDYKAKSGSSTTNILAGIDFQMPFYALGTAEAVLAGEQPPPECVGWAYYRYTRPISLMNNVSKEKKGRTETAETYIAHAKNWARQHIQHIRQGRFPVSPLKCSDYCDFQNICRYFSWRAAAKSESSSIREEEGTQDA